MTNNIDVAKAAQILSEKNNILLLCHKNPDGDTLGSAAGLCHALHIKGKRVAVLCSDEISPKYDFMQIPLYKGQFEVHFIVSVDVASQQLLGENLEKYAQSVDLCIDHHGSNSNYAKMLCCFSDMAATAQLMLEIIQAMGCEINKLVANCLYTGLVTDTGCFKYSSTTPSTHIAAAKLMELGADNVEIVDKFFMSKTRKNIALQKYMLNNLEFVFEDKCAIIALTQEILNEVQPSTTDIDGISAMPRTIEGV
ncbi:MAG: DHH family phosphoesterase, partial [Oscillospiraceae bacterium]